MKLEVCKQDELKHQADKIGELKLKPSSFPVAQISLSRNKKPSLFFLKKDWITQQHLVCGKFLQIINYYKSARGAAAFLLTPGAGTRTGWV